MGDKHDAVIVGGGLGGLTAAAVMAREGMSVRLFERHSQAGGYATTFFRDRFEFECSLHELSGIGTPDNRGPVYLFFEALGITDEVHFIQASHLYRAVGDGVDVRVPPGFDEARHALGEAFPHERKGFDRLFDLIVRVGREADLVKATGSRPSPAAALTRYPSLAHAAGTSLGTVLYRYLKDPRARVALGQLWGYFGLPPSQLSLLLFAVATYSYLRFGGCLIKEKSQALANALVRVIQRAGSRVSLADGVSQILVDEGRVRGVVTDHGEEVRADLVVANANPITTCTQLIDPAELPEEFLRRLGYGQPSISAASLYLGLSRPSRELGIEDHEVYINEVLDMEEQYARCSVIGPQGLVGVCAYDVENPEFGPPGTGVVTLTTLSDGRAWERIEPEQYPALKQRLAESMLASVAKLYPDLPEAIETAVVATPVTNMRYTGNPAGAIYGFANTPPHGPGFRLANRGSLEGLWFVGAWTQPSGGYQGVISSGMIVADAILAERGGERSIPTAVDLARSLGPYPAGGAWRKIRGFGPLLRDIKQVGETVRTKYKIPGEPRADFVPADTSAETVRQYHADRATVVVREKVEQTSDTVTLRLAPIAGRVPPYYAGQYFNLYIERDGVLTSRPYSISSRPDPDGLLDITVKKKAQGFVSGQLVDDVRVGDEVELTGPAGEFYLNSFRDTDDIVGLAVGSGITPFVSIIEDLAARGSRVRLLLMYGSRTEQEIIFRERLEELDRDNDWLRVVLTLSKPGLGWKGERGRIDKAFLERHLDVSDLAGKTFFVCGPRELYRSILIALGDLGVARGQIRLESYGPPNDVTREQEWPAHVDRQTRFRVWIGDREQPVLVPAGEPLLNSLERAGMEHPAQCRSDVCDSCRLRLEDGDVFVPADELGLRTGHKGFIHPCMAYPVSDLKLER